MRPVGLAADVSNLDRSMLDRRSILGPVAEDVDLPAGEGVGHPHNGRYVVERTY